MIINSFIPVFVAESIIKDLFLVHVKLISPQDLHKSSSSFSDRKDMTA